MIITLCPPHFHLPPLPLPLPSLQFPGSAGQLSKEQKGSRKETGGRRRDGAVCIGLRAVNQSQSANFYVCDCPRLSACVYVTVCIRIFACIGPVVRPSLCVHVRVCTHTPPLLLQSALRLARTPFIADTAEPLGLTHPAPSHTPILLTSMLLWHDSSLSPHSSPSPRR